MPNNLAQIPVDLDWLAQHVKFERVLTPEFKTVDGHDKVCFSRLFHTIEAVIEELRKDTYTDSDGYQHVICHGVYALRAVRMYEAEPDSGCARYGFIMTFARWTEAL